VLFKRHKPYTHPLWAIKNTSQNKMEKILVIIILILSQFSVFSQLRKKDKIEITFNITDFEGKPIQSAHITIETIDKKQNSRYGSYSHKESVNNYDSSKESIFKLAISKSKFSDRKISINVLDMRNLAPYFKRYEKEFETVSNRQTIDIQMEFDEEAYKNRTSTINFDVNYLLQPNNKKINNLDEVFKSSFNGKIYTEDLEKSILDTAIISFTIDTNCNIINRQIRKKILGLRTDIEKEVMNSLELRLKELFVKDQGCSSVDIEEFRIFLNLE